jgi:hypothetical protein
MYERLKKNSEWSILKLGDFNIDNIKKEVSSFEEEWYSYTKRQETFYTHKDTKMFPICLTDEAIWKPGDVVEVSQHNKFINDQANIEIDIIFEKLEDIILSQNFSLKKVRFSQILFWRMKSIEHHLKHKLLC